MSRPASLIPEPIDVRLPHDDWLCEASSSTRTLSRSSHSMGVLRHSRSSYVLEQWAHIGFERVHQRAVRPQHIALTLRVARALEVHWQRLGLELLAVDSWQF